MSARPPEARVPIQGPLLVLCAVAFAAVARAPDFPRPFLVAFVTAVGLRLALGRSGAGLLPRRALQVLTLTVAALSIGYLLPALAHSGRADQPDALLSLMCVVSVFQGLCLLCRQTTFTWFLLILLSSVHASGAAIESRDALGVGFVLVYVFLLGWTLLHFERRISLDRVADGDSAVRLIRASGDRPVPFGVAARTMATLVLFGFPLGLVLYLAAPRGLMDRQFPWHDGEKDHGEVDLEGAARAGEDPGNRPTVIATTGPGKGVPFGSVTEIKKDFTAWFEVWTGDGKNLPQNVILRDNVQDLYEIRGSWRDTLSTLDGLKRYLDLDDGRLDQWTPLGRKDDPARARTRRIEFKKGGNRRLYLQPEPIRVQVRRGGMALPGYAVTETANKTFAVSFRVAPGDNVLQRYVPPSQNDNWLRGRRSDREISPSAAYLQVPVGCAAAMRTFARGVVGSEPDPWKRARLLERWLKSEAFTYTLKMPKLDPRNPIVDFMTSTRSANCEGFAIALTLMLRTLGHPARYVRGFWGGDRQEERRSVVLRGSHYHAWTEVFLDGAGWVPLNPTPPDRRAADGGSVTVETGARAGEGEDDGFSFLGYDYEQWQRFWQRVGRGLDRHLVQPVGVLFTRRAWYAGPLLLLVGLWVLTRRRESARVRSRVVPAGGTLPKGAYGKALLMLARKGMRRRGNQTARAFCRVAAVRFPRAREPMTTLTRVHERERYGGGAPAEQRLAATSALADLKEALKRRTEAPQP